MLDEQSIEKAISFVTERGTVTSAELHAHLVLPDSVMASEVLLGPLTDGRLVKSGKYWGLAGTSPNEDTYQPPEDPESLLSDGDRVIAFIKRQPNLRATNHEVCKLLKLEQNEVPASRLGTCLATGRLRRFGTSWMVGLGEIGAAQKVAEAELAGLPPALVSELSKPAQKLAAAVSAPAVVIATDSSDPAPRVATIEPHFRIGDWSDGSIELQRNGVHLATLTKDEFEQIGKFWSLRAA